MTAALSELIPYLEQHGVLAVDEGIAAPKTRDTSTPSDKLSPRFEPP